MGGVPTACAIRALLLELLPFLGSSAGRPGIVLSQDELQRKTLELLRLLPPNLLGLQVGLGTPGDTRWHRVAAAPPGHLSPRPLLPALPAPRVPQPRRPGQAAPVRAAGGRGGG